VARGEWKFQGEMEKMDEFEGKIELATPVA